MVHGDVPPFDVGPNESGGFRATQTAVPQRPAPEQHVPPGGSIRERASGADYGLRGSGSGRESCLGGTGWAMVWTSRYPARKLPIMGLCWKFADVDQFWSLFSCLGEGCAREVRKCGRAGRSVGWSGDVVSGVAGSRVLGRFGTLVPGVWINYMESQNHGQNPVLGPPMPSQGIKHREFGGENPSKRPKYRKIGDSM